MYTLIFMLCVSHIIEHTTGQRWSPRAKRNSEKILFLQPGYPLLCWSIHSLAIHTDMLHILRADRQWFQLWVRNIHKYMFHDSYQDNEWDVLISDINRIINTEMWLSLKSMIRPFHNHLINCTREVINDKLNPTFVCLNVLRPHDAVEDEIIHVKDLLIAH